ncbi:MAG: Hsp20/alpha crystallin family protein [Candidatus Brocadiia bacterium]
MAFRDLIPWNRRPSQLPVRRDFGDAFQALQEDMNRLFDPFLGGSDWGLPQVWPGFEGAFAPRINVSEDEKAVRVRAELPGMAKDDIDISLTDDTLTIEGEKKEEHEEKERDRTYSECTYGRFRRDIPLPSAVDRDKVEADYKNGVLTVTLPKTPEAESRRKRIEVKTES